MQGQLTWYQMGKIDGQKTPPPKWARTFGIGDDGTVFAPAALSGNETVAVMSAGFDGVPAASNLNHVFLPTTWLKTEYKANADLVSICTRIEELAAVQVQDGD